MYNFKQVNTPIPIPFNRTIDKILAAPISTACIHEKFLVHQWRVKKSES